MTKMRALRESRNWTQKQFARACGLHQSQASAFETGTGKAGRSVQERIAAVLSVPPTQIFDGDGFPIVLDDAEALAR